MKYKQWRIAKRDGQIIQQVRTVTSRVTNAKWWKPWAYKVEYDYSEWFDEPLEELYTFRIGDRVEVKQTAGFHKGAMGEVKFIEPRGRIWVLRDNSGSPVYYHNDELKLIWRTPQHVQQTINDVQ